MKYLKLYENYESIEEVEDHLLNLIDRGLAERIEVKLIGKKSRGKWVPSHYAILFKTYVKSVCETLEDLKLNKEVYDAVYQIAYRWGLKFKFDSTNRLILYVEVGENVKNFFSQLGERSGSSYIVFAENRYIGLSLDKINDDFSIKFLSRFSSDDVEEKLEFIKNKIKDFDAEVRISPTDNRLIELTLNK
jgi:predicted hydrocarbon binding protein